MTYSGFEPCPKLKPGERCIRVRESSPPFPNRLHCHIPQSRLSQGDIAGLLKALVIVYSGTEGPGVVAAYLNSRGKDPARDPRMNITPDDPEPGVLRFHCGTSIEAWIDTVVRPEVFRS